jgi:hypothetical protein
MSNVEPPSNWDCISKKRVSSHFDNFKLARRFAIAACSRLVDLSYMLNCSMELPCANDVREDLKSKAKSYYQVHKNSWQTAMHQALANSDWYCNGGFNSYEIYQ